MWLGKFSLFKKSMNFYFRESMILNRLTDIIIHHNRNAASILGKFAAVPVLTEDDVDRVSVLVSD